ncbi:type I DNA topoisomerase [Salinibius halmophilus]|uniref:type I DNA topoisomerase n=1 Tax=Salinibius halmophilus TaxID=1853216 RepID=UPI000E667669|nr:type I DNA topoisomerase [Salinibius halmophilus]
MGKALVIVESPAKAKTINKYLGNQYIVKSSVGHIRDLPTGASGSKIDPKERARLAAEARKLPPEERERRKRERKHVQLIERMGVNPEKNWEAHYELLPGKEKVVEELRRAAKTADVVYLATDLDREGEAIAWHLQQAIGGDAQKYRRVVFNEITKSAIQEAFSKPSDVDLDHVHAQQARRFLDRVVGFMVSPLLWEKVARGLSAGRVQSVAVRLIVEREREIRAFNPEEFWMLNADMVGKNGQAEFEVVKYQGKSYRPTSKAESDKLVALFSGAEPVVSKREDKPTKSKPAAPFITSTMQQAASTRLGFSVKKTMTLAQRLYEAGHITYMRTDSTNLSKDALEQVRSHIGQEYGDKYLPEQPNFYGSKKNAQEAHEAIRPTDVATAPGSIDAEPDAKRLYELIWRRFVACQMTQAEYLSTTIEVTSGDFISRVKGRIQTFDGFTRVMPTKTDEPELPNIQQGETLSLADVKPSQHFTKPPARFSEAALVKELEKRGIGRPSTYAAIISTIQDRGYVRLENRRFYAEKMGDIVTDRLVESFSDLLDYSFTAEMENELDHIAKGQKNWQAVLDEFYGEFKAALETAGSDTGMRANEPTPTDIDCPTCGRKMMIRTGSTGVFLGCSGYSLPPKERCTQTMNLASDEDIVNADLDDDDAETHALRQRRRCPKCSTAMDSYLVDDKRKLHVCGNNPDCDGYEIEHGTFQLKGYDGPTLECDKCGSDMQLKSGRFGKYFGCTNDECKNTRKVLKNGQPAPPKMDPVPMPELKCLKVEDTYILRDGASGLFLAASQFPKNRETRPPKVVELVPHKEEIDPKYHYIIEGPRFDDEGNPTVIRFSRKMQQQYLMTENEDGKATGWQAYYEDGKWAVKEKKKRSAKK